MSVLSNKIIQSEIYFKKVQQTKVGGTYFYLDKIEGMIVPVIILEGAWERNGRLSNFWYCRNLKTGKKENGYGNFYKLKCKED